MTLLNHAVLVEVCEEDLDSPKCVVSKGSSILIANSDNCELFFFYTTPKFKKWEFVENYVESDTMDMLHLTFRPNWSFGKK